MVGQLSCVVYSKMSYFTFFCICVPLDSLLSCPLATAKGDKDVISLLLQNKANVNDKTDNGRTALKSGINKNVLFHLLLYLHSP